MKTILILLLTIFWSGFMISCEDYLEQEPVGVFSESIILNKEGLNKLIVGAYSCLNGDFASPNNGQMATPPCDLVYGSMRAGEAFKGTNFGDQPSLVEIMQLKITSGNTELTGYWNFFWTSIFRCNQVLSIMSELTDMSDTEKIQVEAEMRFLRGHFYFYAKKAFRNIPWLDESNVSDFLVPNFDATGDYVDVWPQILADFDFARQNLPPTQSLLGKPNNWAAEAYYGKVLIYMSGDGYDKYGEALTVLTNVIDNGVTSKGEKYDLLPRYHDNFRVTTENNVESVFAVQHSSQDGTSGTGNQLSPNGLQVSTLIGVNGVATAPGWGRGWGFYQPTPWYADHFRVNEKGLPLLDMYTDMGTRLKTDMGLLSSQPFTIDTAAVDPRLDWTITRRGIPCLDYGIAPGASWIRDQSTGGPYISKKYFIYNSEKSGYESTSGFLRNALNVNVIRFADVLLMAAECEARVGSLSNARTLVNRVRQRMVDNSNDPQNWVKKEDNTNAANYKISIYPSDGSADDPFTSIEEALDAILFERALELGTEGFRFYDVVRYEQAEKIFSSYFSAEKNTFAYLNASEYTAVPDAILPIPRQSIDRSLKDGIPTLKQNPGY